MTFNLDTIWVTVVAGLIVIGTGFWARKKLTEDTEDHVPSKIQILWETIVTQVTTQVESNLGKVNPFDEGVHLAQVALDLRGHLLDDVSQMSWILVGTWSSGSRVSLDWASSPARRRSVPRSR